MEQVKWSCKACNYSGVIEYNPPGNPYRIGYQAYKAHSDASPYCSNHLLDFDPERLGLKKFVSLRRSCSEKMSDEDYKERWSKLVNVLGEEELNKMVDAMAPHFCCQETVLATLLYAIETLGFIKREEGGKKDV